MDPLIRCDVTTVDHEVWLAQARLNASDNERRQVRYHLVEIYIDFYKWMWHVSNWTGWTATSKTSLKKVHWFNIHRTLSFQRHKFLIICFIYKICTVAFVSHRFVPSICTIFVNRADSFILHIFYQKYQPIISQSFCERNKLMTFFMDLRHVKKKTATLLIRQQMFQRWKIINDHFYSFIWRIPNGRCHWIKFINSHQTWQTITIVAAPFQADSIQMICVST